ncbi:MAG: 3-hydroxyacyl-CoA dehydrogenase NAD-binding domain-containing protein [Steroidobacteraceae bacterium]
MLEPQPSRLPRRIAVVGSGTIGPDIAYYLLSDLPGAQVLLVDIDAAALTRARERLAGYADKGVKRGKLTAQQAAEVVRNLSTSTDYASMKDCDWVLEAATENLALKRRIFSDIEAVVPPQAWITSNTSSLPARRLFSHLARPGRATVTHFFAPAFQNPVVEVVGWPGVSAQVLRELRWVFASTGKVPMITADQVCFMLDRIFDNWCNESGLLLDRASAAQVDSVAQEFVHAGPFFVLNLSNGNPIIIETNALQAKEEGAHYQPAPVFTSVDRWKTTPPGKSVEVPAETRAAIRDRLLGILYSQSLDILDRRIGEPADLDLGCRLAFGFRQGPLASMKSLGEAEVDRILARLAKERAGMPGRRRPLSAYLDFRRDVLIDDMDGIRVITLRRPEALNALHDGLTDEILGAIREVEHDAAIRGYVITGYGNRAFCAGADIGRFPSLLGDAPAAAEYARACSRLLVHLDALCKPVVAALNGMALGGGLELAMRAHAIIAVTGTTLQFPEITLGIVPGIGAMVVPYRRWPKASSLLHRMLRNAERVRVEEAAALGIIDECVERGQLLRRAIAWVDRLASGPRGIPDGPASIAALPHGPALSGDGKPLSARVLGILEGAIATAAAAATLDSALEIGYQAFGDSACTAAAREGVDSFMQRRAADFSRTG